MALLSYALCTVADVQKQSGVTYTGDDLTVVENMINLVTRFAENYIGRFIKGRGSNIDEYHDVEEETNELFLRNFPIISVATVQENPDDASPPTPLVVTTDYLISHASGRLIRRDGSWYRGNGLRSVKVSYQGGYATVPEDLMQWAVEAVIALFADKTRGDVQSERVGQLSVTYATASTANIANLVAAKPYLLGVLNMYKVLDPL